MASSRVALPPDGAASSSHLADGVWRGIPQRPIRTCRFPFAPCNPYTSSDAVKCPAHLSSDDGFRPTKREGKSIFSRPRQLDAWRLPAAAEPASASLEAAKASSVPVEEDYHPSQGWRARPHHLDKDQLWARCRQEAQQDADSEPRLASFLYSTILAHPTLEKCLAFLLAKELDNTAQLGPLQLMLLLQEVYANDPEIVASAVADMLAVKDRDPACEKYSQCLLYFKGFQAIQSHRVAHWLWKQNRKPLALAMQSRMSEVFHTDIHPAAVLGRGILLDHATGIVIGETAVVGDNVSMLHRVSLGGSGTGTKKRHPTIGHGVLLGAGVSVLGPISIGAGSKVGAGSVVVTSIPEHCVAVGVPARVVKRDLLKEPVQDMDQVSGFILDYVI